METLYAILIVHACLFAVALVFILMSSIPSRGQKMAQTLFSFVLPILGPCVTLIVHVSDRMKPGVPSDRYMGQAIDECRYVWYFPY